MIIIIITYSYSLHIRTYNIRGKIFQYWSSIIELGGQTISSIFLALLAGKTWQEMKKSN